MRRLLSICLSFVFIMSLFVPSFADSISDNEQDSEMVLLSENIKIHYDSAHDELILSEKDNSPSPCWNGGIGRCKSRYKTFYKTFTRNTAKKYLKKINLETSKVREFVRWILSKIHLDGLGIEKVVGAAGGTDALKYQLKKFVKSKKSKAYFKLYAECHNNNLNHGEPTYEYKLLKVRVDY